MFAGIRASLKSAAQRSIDVAERNLDNPLAIRLLKALFLVKYVESFQATPRNLTVLVYDRFGLDLPGPVGAGEGGARRCWRRRPTSSATATSTSTSPTKSRSSRRRSRTSTSTPPRSARRLFKILSGDVIKTNKIRYAKNGQDFPFGFKLDDQVHGPQRELPIHFITPEYPYTPDEIRMHSAGKDELRVILDPDDRVLADLRLLHQDREVHQAQADHLAVGDRGPDPSVQGARRTSTARRNSSSASAAPWARPPWSSTPPTSPPDSQDAAGPGDRRLPGPHQPHLHPAQAARRRHLQRAAGRRRPPTPTAACSTPTPFSKLATPARGGPVVHHSARRPRRAGHGQDDRRHLPGQALRLGPRLDRGPRRLPDRQRRRSRSRSTATSSSAARSPPRCATPRSTRTQSSPRRRPSTSARSPPSASSAPTSSTRPTRPRTRWSWPATAPTSSRASSTSSRPPSPARSTRSSSQLSGPIGLLDQVVGKPDDWYLTDFNLGDDLLDAKENVIDPIQVVPQRRRRRPIYDEAAALLTTHSSNLGYLPSGSDETVRTALADPNAFRGNKMAQLKQATDQLRAQIDERRRREPRRRHRGRSRAARPNCSASTFYAKATPDAQAERAPANRPDARPSSRREARSPSSADRVELRGDHLPGAARPARRCPQRRRSGDDTPSHRSRPCPSRPSRCPARPASSRPRTDVDNYLAALRSALVQTLNDGKRISL